MIPTNSDLDRLDRSSCTPHAVARMGTEPQELTASTKFSEETQKVFSAYNLGSIDAENIGACSTGTIAQFLSALDSLLSRADLLIGDEAKTLKELKTHWQKTLDISLLSLKQLSQVENSREYINRRDIIINDVISYLETHRVCYFPFGFTTQYGKHLLVLKLTLNDENLVQAEFSNRGDGCCIQGHLIDEDKNLGLVFSNVSLPPIPLDRFKNSHFLQTLHSLRMDFCFDVETGTLQKNISSRTQYSSTTDVKIALEQWPMGKGGEIRIGNGLRPFHRGDSCSTKPMTSLLRDLGISRKTEKRLKLWIRLLTLENFLQHGNPDTYQKFEIDWALSKISKTCLQLGKIDSFDFEKVEEILNEGKKKINLLYELEKRLTNEHFESLISDTTDLSYEIPNSEPSYEKTERVLYFGSLCDLNLQSVLGVKTLPLATDRAEFENVLDLLMKSKSLVPALKSGDLFSILGNILATFIRARQQSPLNIDQIFTLHLSILNELINKFWPQLRIFNPENEKFLKAFIQVLKDSSDDAPFKEYARIIGDNLQFPGINPDNKDKFPFISTYEAIPSSDPRIRGLFSEKLPHTIAYALTIAHRANTELHSPLVTDPSIPSATMLTHALINALLSRTTKNILVSFNITKQGHETFSCEYPLGNKKTEENKGTLWDEVYPFTPYQKTIFLPILDRSIWKTHENEAIQKIYQIFDPSLQKKENFSFQEYHWMALANLYDDLIIPMWIGFLSNLQEITPSIGACVESSLATRKANGPSILEECLTEKRSDTIANLLLHFLEDRLNQIQQDPLYPHTRQTLLRILARSFAYLQISSLNNGELENRLKKTKTVLLNHLSIPPSCREDCLTFLSLYPYIEEDPDLLSKLKSIEYDQSILETPFLKGTQEGFSPYEEDIKTGIKNIFKKETIQKHIIHFILQSLSSTLVDPPPKLELNKDNTYTFLDGGIHTRLTITSKTDDYERKGISYVLEKELKPGQMYRLVQLKQEDDLKSLYDTLSMASNLSLDFWLGNNKELLVFPQGNSSKPLYTVTWHLGKTGTHRVIQKGNRDDFFLAPLDSVTQSSPFLRRLCSIEDADKIFVWTDKENKPKLIEIPRYKFQLKLNEETKTWSFIHPQFADAIVDFSKRCDDLMPFSHYLPLKIGNRKVIVMPNTLFISDSIYRNRDDEYTKGITHTKPDLLQFELNNLGQLEIPSDTSLTLYLFFLSLYAHEYKRAEKLLQNILLDRSFWGETESELIDQFLHDTQDHHPYAALLRKKLLDHLALVRENLSERQKKARSSARYYAEQLITHGLTSDTIPLNQTIYYSSRIENRVALIRHNQLFTDSKKMTLASPPDQALPLRCDNSFFTLYFPYLYSLLKGTEQEVETLTQLLLRTRNQALQSSDSFCYSFLFSGVLKKRNREDLTHILSPQIDEYLKDPKKHQKELNKALVEAYNLLLPPDSIQNQPTEKLFDLPIIKIPDRKIFPERKKHLSISDPFDITNNSHFPSFPEEVEYEDDFPVNPLLECSLKDSFDLREKLSDHLSTLQGTSHERLKTELLELCFYETTEENHLAFQKTLKASIDQNFETHPDFTVVITNPNIVGKILDKNITSLVDERNRAKEKLLQILCSHPEIKESQRSLQKQVKLLKSLSDEEILVAFAKRDIDTFLTSNPDLTENDITSLKHYITLYLKNRTELTHLLKAKKLLNQYMHEPEKEKQEIIAQNFYDCIHTSRGYDISNKNYEALLVFEALSEVRLREEQVEALNQMTDKNRVELEARPGFGKSSVLIPLWLFLTSSIRKERAVFVVPATLLTDQKNLLKRVLGKNLHQKICTLTFDRKDASNYNQLLKIYNLLTNSNEVILFMDIKSLYGITITALKARLHEESIHPTEDGMKILDLLQKISLFFKNEARIFIDESAECTDPRERYDYTLKTEQPVSEEQIQEVHGFWKYILLSPRIQENWLFQCFSQKDTAFGGRKLLTEENISSFENEISQITQHHFFPNHSNGKEIVEHLKGKSSTPSVERALKSLPKEKLREYASYRYQIHMIKSFLLKKYQEDYVLNEDLQVVPCKRGEIKQGSNFSNIYQTLNTTLQAHLQRDLTLDIIKDFIEEVKENSNPKATLLWNVLKHSCKLPSSFNSLTKDHIDQITCYLNQCPVLKLNFIASYLLPKTSTYPFQVSATSFQLLDQLKTVLLASGTPRPNTLPPDIELLKDLTGSNVNSLIAIWKKSSIKTIERNPGKALVSLLEDPIYKNSSSPPIIVDAGGNFSSLSEDEVCSIFFENNPHIKAVCFYATEKDSNGYLVSKAKIRNRGSMLSAPRETSALQENEIGIFIKQGNIIGSDLPMPLNAKGYITLDETTSLSDLLQGSSRLRDLKRGQTIDLAITTQASNAITAGIESFSKKVLFTHLVKKQADQNGQDYFFCLGLLLNALVEKHLWESQKYSSQTLLERFKFLKEFVISSSSIDPLDLLYQPIERIDARSAVKNLKKGVLHKLEQKQLPFIDIEAIENRFDNSIHYKNLPSSIPSRTSDEIAYAEQIEEAQQQEEVDQLLYIEKNTPFEPATPILWDGNYATIFQGQPNDHLLGIDIYHSPNFSHLSSNPHDPIHKFSYFYLVESTPNGLKVMALDLHDANLIIHKIKTNSSNQHNYYLICGNKIVSHNLPSEEIDSIFISHDTQEIHKGLGAYRDQLSILSKILTGNPKISAKDRIYLSGLEPEKLLSVKEFVQKYERFWPNLKKLRGL